MNLAILQCMIRAQYSSESYMLHKSVKPVSL